MTRLVLLRHGQTDWNVEGRFQGWMDIELNEVGREQALAAAPVVAQERPEAIISSPLQRALVTASAVADQLGQPVYTDDRFREINVGTWGGLTGDQMAEQDPTFAEAIRSGRDFRRSPTGETAEEVGLRVGPALEDLAARTGEGTLLVASHGLAIHMGVAHLMGWDHDRARQLVVLRNCHWAVLSGRAGDRWRLEAWNLHA